MSNKNTFLRFVIPLVWIFSTLVGCSDEQNASLHESDHFVPEHWPSDLDDATKKIRERVVLLSESPTDTTFNELFDIVGWVPEVAADTELSESDWLPIHEAAQDVSELIRNDRKLVNEATKSKIDAFCEVISTGAENIKAMEAKSVADIGLANERPTSSSEVLEDSEDTSP